MWEMEKQGLYERFMAYSAKNPVTLLPDQVKQLQEIISEIQNELDYLNNIQSADAANLEGPSVYVPF